MLVIKSDKSENAVYTEMARGSIPCGPTSKVLSNTTFNITETIDVSGWAEGNYSMTCNVRDA